MERIRKNYRICCSSQTDLLLSRYCGRGRTKCQYNYQNVKNIAKKICAINKHFLISYYFSTMKKYFLPCPTQLLKVRTSLTKKYFLFLQYIHSSGIIHRVSVNNIKDVYILISEWCLCISMLLNMPELLIIMCLFIVLDDCLGFLFSRSKRQYGYISVIWALKLH